jgi:transposase
VVLTRDAQLGAVEDDLAAWFDRAPFAETVQRLGAYRGVTHMGGLTLAAEVCDWRRFAGAHQFMGFVGLVPTEYSSGGSTRRGHLTKAGNAHIRAQLVESAWTYQHRPYVGATIAKRHDGVPPETVARAWAAQLRLCGRFRHLAAQEHQERGRRRRGSRARRLPLGRDDRGLRMTTTVEHLRVRLAG